QQQRHQQQQRQPQQLRHHQHQYHPYLSISRHSPTTKIQHDSTSNLTTSTNKNNYQHTLSPLSIKDKIQHQHIDPNGKFKSIIIVFLSIICIYVERR
ncbi:unnamed protein product, partial [Rotaria socialis]